MPYQKQGDTVVFGEHEANTLAQIKRCAEAGSAVGSVLCADGHLGYSMPIGGVVAYPEHVSPSGVGYDIACGNKAVETDIRFDEIRGSLSSIADQIFKEISFGVGRKNARPIDHPLFDDPAWQEISYLRSLKSLAYSQLGTVGSGNHYVDVFVDEATGKVWVGVHFGSRGFGHKTASGFLNLAAGRRFDDRAPGESMDQPPTLIPSRSQLGQEYIRAMTLAGRYAYAGRDTVVNLVLRILGARAVQEVHNHHNFAWEEEHGGQRAWVVRKGATPCFPGQMGFIGGSMGDISVIIRGKESGEAEESLYSTVHGAGRIMSRMMARGNKKRTGLISREQMYGAVRDYNVVLRGAGVDESPFVYRKLRTVLDAHRDSIEILHELKPVIVCMAGEGEFDPYKD